MALLPRQASCFFSSIKMLYCHNTKLILLQFFPSLKVDSKTRSSIIHVGLSFNAHRSRGSGAKSSGCIARGTRPVGGGNC